MLCTWGSQIPGWVLSGASVDLNFAAGTYFPQSLSSSITTTRASTGYALTSAGLLVPFATNTARITDQGLLLESAGTNVVLWNRDLTNAAWTASNVTVSNNQVGADGVAASASSLTATAGNGTVLQAITLASSARFQTAFVKRLTGSGVINMTTDNGATWTAIVPTAAWTQLSIPTQTLANPTVGFRIVTSGDAIAVDFVQNETGTFATSPILTTTVAVTRAADVITLSGSALTAALAAKSMLFINNGSQAAAVGSTRAVDFNGAGLMILSSGTVVTVSSGGNSAAATLGSGATTGLCKSAFGFDGTSMTAVANGGTKATSANAWASASPVYVGNNSAGTKAVNGYLQRLAFSATKGQFDGLTV